MADAREAGTTSLADQVPPKRGRTPYGQFVVGVEQLYNTSPPVATYRWGTTELENTDKSIHGFTVAIPDWRKTTLPESVKEFLAGSSSQIVDILIDAYTVLEGHIRNRYHVISLSTPQRSVESLSRWGSEDGQEFVDGLLPNIYLNTWFATVDERGARVIEDQSVETEIGDWNLAIGKRPPHPHWDIINGIVQFALAEQSHQ